MEALSIDGIINVITIIECFTLTHSRMNKLTALHLYILEETNCNFSCVRLCDLDTRISREKWLNYLQTVTLLRVSRLKWVNSIVFDESRI